MEHLLAYLGNLRACRVPQQRAKQQRCLPRGGWLGGGGPGEEARRRKRPPTTPPPQTPRLPPVLVRWVAAAGR
eukprot:6537083-Alexandrium_andersonii.AAC.1